VWLLRILLSGEPGQAYNVGSEREISIVELARVIERLCGCTIPAVPSTPPASDAPPRYVPDTLKARRTLKLEELTPLELALSKTINWSRSAVTG
jgi:nucleoside-diphosphate-sugar epimerase